MGYAHARAAPSIDGTVNTLTRGRMIRYHIIFFNRWVRKALNYTVHERTGSKERVSSFCIKLI